MEPLEVTSSSESVDDLYSNLESVVTYLSDKLDRLGYQFRRFRYVDENNLPPPEDSDDKETLLKYELRYLMCLINLLQSEDPLPWWCFPAHILMDAINVLKEEINSMNVLLSHCKNKLEDDKKELSELENRLHNIEEMKKKLEEDTTSRLPVESVKARRHNLNALFQHEKKRLESVLVLFPGILQDLLKTVTTTYFSEDSGDPYISLENAEQYQDLELLLEANIITRHPHDSKKIRLSNFLE